MQISTISLDDQLQPRVVIDDGLRDEYAALMQQGVRFPPVVVFHDEGVHLLADGFHRVHAARVAGLDQIEAEVHQGGRQAALRHSLAANAAHGQRRSSGDYQRAYRIAVVNDLLDPVDVDAVASTLRCTSRWARSLTQNARNQRQVEREAAILQSKAQGKSNREIARELGVDHHTISAGIARGEFRNTSKILHPAAKQSLAPTRSPPAASLPSADFWKHTPEPDIPVAAPAMSPEDEARLARAIERERNAQSPRGRRWMAAFVLLEQFGKHPTPDDLFADVDPEIPSLIGHHLARAHEWINRFMELYNDHV